MLAASALAACTCVATVADASMLVSISGTNFHSSKAAIYTSGAITYFPGPSAADAWAALPHVWRTATTGNYSVYVDGKGSGGTYPTACIVNTYDFREICCFLRGARGRLLREPGN